ncbi:hypothetical protein ABZS61_11770 [Streptomyces sp. NPDC005566]|uniref:hypothetical protein n=1 Tax=Streptomyces sp. NPDC005566 TaxID=3156886 RepID=UPI0033BBBDB2
MISEPEMVGEFGGAVETPEVMGDSDRDPVGRRRRPWLWALGGAVMASALWAAALLSYGVGDQAPDMHGYRLDRDPCPVLRLKAIGTAIAPRESANGEESELSKHAALDQVQCSVPLRGPSGNERTEGGWTVEYAVGITVELHKKTEPGAEFEARLETAGPWIDREAKLETVPDLGDAAYLRTSDDGYADLWVLEGGAVLSLSLSASPQYESADRDGAYNEVEVGDEAGEEPGTPDLSPHHSAMISDMRDLMSVLRE